MEPGARAGRGCRIVQILLGLVALALAWPLFYLFALLFGHGYPPRYVIYAIYAAPILLVLIGVVSLVTPSRRALRIAAGLGIALVLDLAILIHEISDPTPARRQYRVDATLIDGRLAFVPRDEDDSGCIGAFSMSSPGGLTATLSPGDNARLVMARIVWAIEAQIPHRPGACRAEFPLFYGAVPRRMIQSVSPKRVRAGVNYSIHVSGGHGPGGTGCFRFTQDRRIENFRSDGPCRFLGEIAPAQPHGDPASYITEADYPDAALRMNEEGTVGFVLAVGPNGRVTSCTITRSSGSSILDATTCRLMRTRARFTPAIDSTGNPVPSLVEQEVAWTLVVGRRRASTDGG